MHTWKSITAHIRRAWQGVVWYMREISGEARYDHYLEHMHAHHPHEEPLDERAWLREQEQYQRLHPNTSCCC